MKKSNLIYSRQIDARKLLVSNKAAHESSRFSRAKAIRDLCYYILEAVDMVVVLDDVLVDVVFEVA